MPESHNATYCFRTFHASGCNFVSFVKIIKYPFTPLAQRTINSDITKLTLLSLG